MVQAILVWSGAVLAIVVLLLMALGPVIVEVDSWWYERKHGRRRSTVAGSVGSAASAGSTGSSGSAGSVQRAPAPVAPRAA